MHMRKIQDHNQENIQRRQYSNIAAFNTPSGKFPAPPIHLIHVTNDTFLLTYLHTKPTDCSNLTT